MTGEQKALVSNLRANGVGYGTIAKRVGLSENTVKSFCRRNGIPDMAPVKSTEIHKCRLCGATVPQIPGRKEKKFCSDACRNKWWNTHLDLVDRRATREVTCQYCGKMFLVYGKRERKYCSHACYISHRFGGNGDD